MHSVLVSSTWSEGLLAARASGVRDRTGGGDAKRGGRGEEGGRGGAEALKRQKEAEELKAKQEAEEAEKKRIEEEEKAKNQVTEKKEEAEERREANADDSLSGLATPPLSASTEGSADQKEAADDETKKEDAGTASNDAIVIDSDEDDVPLAFAPRLAVLRGQRRSISPIRLLLQAHHILLPT